MQERLANVIADHRFHSRMAHVAAMCGMDAFKAEGDDLTS
jgi:hypothetical protein